MKNFLFGLILSFFLVSIVLGQVIYDKGSFVHFTWSEITTDIQGNPVTEVSCEFKLVRDVTGETFGPYLTNGTELTISRPKSGVFVIWGRSLRYVDGVPIYSEWMNSLMPEYTRLEDGITPGQFKVRFKPSGPTGPIIIY